MNGFFAIDLDVVKLFLNNVFLPLKNKTIDEDSL